MREYAAVTIHCARNFDGFMICANIRMLYPLPPKSVVRGRRGFRYLVNNRRAAREIRGSSTRMEEGLAYVSESLS